jgi:hypothetical protein
MTNKFAQTWSRRFAKYHKDTKPAPHTLDRWMGQLRGCHDDVWHRFVVEQWGDHKLADVNSHAPIVDWLLNNCGHLCFVRPRGLNGWQAPGAQIYFSHSDDVMLFKLTWLGHAQHYRMIAHTEFLELAALYFTPNPIYPHMR